MALARYALPSRVLIPADDRERGPPYEYVAQGHGTEGVAAASCAAAIKIARLMNSLQDRLGDLQVKSKELTLTPPLPRHARQPRYLLATRYQELARQNQPLPQFEEVEFRAFSPKWGRRHPPLSLLSDRHHQQACLGDLCWQRGRVQRRQSPSSITIGRDFSSMEIPPILKQARRSTRFVRTRVWPRPAWRRPGSRRKV